MDTSVTFEMTEEAKKDSALFKIGKLTEVGFV